MALTVTGVDAALDRIESAAARARDLTPVLTVAAQDTRMLIDDAFAGSTTPENVPWAPLSPRTLARRRGGSGNPLIDTSNLRGSITSYGRGTTLSFGTNVSYAGPQQFGFSRSGSLKRTAYGPKRAAGTPYTITVPARPFLPIRKAGGYHLMTNGMAGQHWARVRASVRRYIATGEIS